MVGAAALKAGSGGLCEEAPGAGQRSVGDVSGER
jgi:hypothetical protein